MMHVFKRAWADMLMPVLKRPKRLQVAALCTREHGGQTQVLLITSRDTGRWIVPKGWPIDGLDGAGAALQEAWEEAGVAQADITEEPVGMFNYDKGLGEGMTVPVIAQVYRTKVRDLQEEYPDADARKRKWFAPADAAELVEEPELQDILRTL